MLFDLKNQKHDGRSSAKTFDDISTNRRNESQTSTAKTTNKKLLWFETQEFFLKFFNYFSVGVMYSLAVYKLMGFIAFASDDYDIARV